MILLKLLKVKIKGSKISKTRARLIGRPEFFAKRQRDLKIGDGWG